MQYMAYCRANIWHVALGQSDLFETKDHPPPNDSNHCFYSDMLNETFVILVGNLLDNMCMHGFEAVTIQYCNSSHQKQKKLPNYYYSFVSMPQVVSMLVSIGRKFCKKIALSEKDKSDKESGSHQQTLSEKDKSDEESGSHQQTSSEKDKSDKESGSQDTSTATEKTHLLV